MNIKQHLPNFITLCNLIAGCIAIVMLLSQRNPEIAFIFIFFGLFFDFLDGLVARLLGVSSEVGKELDSLADAVSFGVFPALLVMYCFQTYTTYHQIGYLSLMIAAASIYRLANFNLDILQTKFFVGLATPANTLLSIGIYYWCKNFSIFKETPGFILLIIFVFFSSYILNAKLPMFSLKALKKPFYRNTPHIILIIFSVLSILIFRELAIAAIVLFYILLSIIFKKTIINEEVKP